MKVRVNSIYRYEPNGWDTFDRTANNGLVRGQLVRVINLYGCPKANTMGQCYVADLKTGIWCMVSTGSLVKPQGEVLTQRQIKNRLRKLAHANVGTEAIATYHQDGTVNIHLDSEHCYTCDRPKNDCGCVENGGTY